MNEVDIQINIFTFVTGVVSVDDKQLQINAEEGIATAESVNFFNNLFDSVNGNKKNENDDNELRRAVIENSAHHEFWVSAKNVLRNMFYVEKVSRKIVPSVPTLTNWSFSINGFQKIWKILKEKYSFNQFNTRLCNQDPLENFFGQIRSHAVRHTNPTPRQFEDSFITLLVSNMKSVSIIGSNCETVDGDFMLFSLEECLKQDISNVETDGVVRNNDCNDEPCELISDKIVAEESIVASLLERSQEITILILKEVNYCSACNDNFKNNGFLVCIRQITCTVNKLLKTRAHRRNIAKVLIQHFESWHINMDWHECIEHHANMFKMIVRIIVIKTIVWWCEKKNVLTKTNPDNEKLQCDMLKDVFEMRRMRECYRNEKSKRKCVLQEYRHSIRKKMKK